LLTPAVVQGGGGAHGASAGPSTWRSLNEGLIASTPRFDRENSVVTTHLAQLLVRGDSDDR